MAKYDYNLVVIGAGSAGLVTAYVAAAAKAKVALIERHQMGGDCLNTGCVPSKALIRSAAFMRDVRRHKKFGFASAQAEVDFAEVMERIQRTIGKIAPHDSVERYTGLGVECHHGEASLRNANEVEVNGKVLRTRAIVLAAGARPLVPSLPGMADAPVRTSDTIWDIRTQPKRLVVLGGGPIGAELAQAFAMLGSQVTQVVSGARILPREDADAAEAVTQHFQEEGITLLTHSRGREVRNKDGTYTLVVENTQDHSTREVPFDLLLLATGRQPNGDRIPGLDKVGVQTDQRGAVVVNDKLQTSVKNIYACGDLIGSYQFTHTASHAAVTAAINALSPLPFKSRVDWSVVPWCTFTHPEVARVGMSEAEAKEAGLLFEVTKYGIDDLDRAIADEEAHGFVKLLTTKTGQLLGVTIVGSHAGDLLPEYILAMKKQLTPKDILGTIHIYPTMAEANRFAAGEWNKAHLSPGLLKFSEWLNRKLRG